MREVTGRERVALFAGGGIILAILLVVGVVEPYRGAVSRLDSRIETRSRQLESVRALHDEARLLRARLEKNLSHIDRNGGVSHLATLESTVLKVAGRENLAHMKPQPSEIKGEFRETSVEMKLEKVDLGQIVRLLQEIEKGKPPFAVKRMRLSRRYDETSLMDAVVTVSSYGKTP